MPSTSGPLIPRKLLGAKLRELREKAGMSLEDVAAELLVSTSKLSRLEKAQGNPQARDVRDLIKLYRIEGTETAEHLMGWLEAARHQGWWIDYHDTISNELEEHLAYESEAQVARVYTIPVIPVLLQTPDYTRAHYHSSEPWHTEREFERLVQLRIRRLEALNRRSPPPLKLIAVTHESSLRQLVGSADIMRNQLETLIERSKEPNVELRVLPFTAPAQFSISCIYALFEFDDLAMGGVLRIETPAGFRHVEGDERVAEWRRHHERLRERALTPGESRSLIRDVLTDYS